METGNSVTPIIILTKERPLQLADMLISIENVTNNPKIIICDNASTQPEMIGLLDSVARKHTVIRNETNMGFEGFNPGLSIVKDKYFVLTDPDIILNPKMPRNWPEIFYEILDTMNCPKVGVAMDIENLPLTPFGDRTRSCESGMWLNPVAPPFFDLIGYWAAIDTTFAMYRRDTYPFWSDGIVKFNQEKGIVGVHLSQDNYNRKYSTLPIRIAGNFTAIHAGWDLTEKYASDREYYKTHCNINMASTQKWIEENG